MPTSAARSAPFPAGHVVRTLHPAASIASSARARQRTLQVSLLGRCPDRLRGTPRQFWRAALSRPTASAASAPFPAGTCPAPVCLRHPSRAMAHIMRPRRKLKVLRRKLKKVSCLIPSCVPVCTAGYQNAKTRDSSIGGLLKHKCRQNARGMAICAFYPSPSKPPIGWQKPPLTRRQFSHRYFADADAFYCLHRKTHTRTHVRDLADLHGFDGKT